MTRSARRATGFALMPLATAVIVLIAGCAAPASTPTPPPDPTPVPTATPTPMSPAATPEPALPPVTPATKSEPGSEEARVLAALARQVRLFRAKDWVTYRTTCDPTREGRWTVKEIAHLFETTRAPVYGLGYPADDYAGYNIRNARLKFYGQDLAVISQDDYDGDELLAAGRQTTWTKVDGEWYADSFACAAKYR